MSLQTPGLFGTLRAAHLSDKGLYAARDTAYEVVFVVADASFYDLEVFVALATTFSGSAVAASSSTGLRVIANGQVFDCEPCYPVPTWQWSGEIIRSGTVETGAPASKPHSRHLGKWRGRTQAAYDVAQGDPSGVSPGYDQAAGAMLPLVEGSIPFSGLKSNPPGDPVTQHYSPTIATKWMPKPPNIGKVAFGIHRASQLLFFVVQEDRASPGMDVATLITTLASQGVDDAVLGDGSDSTTLVIDGSLEVTPGIIKDAANPVGLALRLRELSVSGGSTVFTSAADAELAATLGELPATRSGPAATLSWTSSGMRVVVSAFASDLAADDLELPALPLTLEASAGDAITSGVVFTDASGLVTLTLTLGTTGPRDPGSLTGTLAIQHDPGSGPTPVCEAQVSWTLSP